ncbi:MAG: nucleotidyltransferase family protein [Neisseriaceae bacterium]|nr:nucleotidyltransferase family protein [Neisseriaceae bacterium]
MILAAGRGERLRPLTDTTPKPLISLGRETLIERHIRRLHLAGIDKIVINTAWLGEKIEQHLGNGSQYGVQIQYSRETNGCLETAGGIATALPLLGDSPFMVVNGDIFSDIDFSAVKNQAVALAHNRSISAHLWLVENPPHHPNGDFSINNNGLLQKDGTPKYTFSGVAVYRPEFFDGVLPNVKRALAPLLFEKSQQNQITATLCKEYWLDVGTIERLEIARQKSALEWA